MSERVTCRFCGYSLDVPKDSPEALDSYCHFCRGIPPQNFINCSDDGRATVRCMAYFFNKLRDRIKADL